MKVLSLPKNPLNIQKCFLPHSRFLQQNKGKYCILTLESQYKFVVKIGLCKVKNAEGIIYLDNSVFIDSSTSYVNNLGSISDSILSKSLVLKTISFADLLTVTVVFNDVFSIQKYDNGRKLKRVLRDILKFFTFCSKSVLSLQDLKSGQDFNIHCLIVTNISNANPQQLYEITSNTEIVVEECITYIQFMQHLVQREKFQFKHNNVIVKLLKEIVLFSQSESVKNKSLKKVLLIGPSGCGKSTLVHLIAAKCNLVLLEISAVDINSGTTNNIVEKLQEIFKKAKIYATLNKMCIILIKNIDLIFGTRISSKKYLGQFVNLLANIQKAESLVMIATTNCIDDIDQSLRSQKIFGEELEVTVPTLNERSEIISEMLLQCNIDFDEDLINQFSTWTPGFVIADLKLLMTETLFRFQKIQGSFLSQMNLSIRDCFKIALTKVIPSALRGEEALCPTNLSFFHIGGLHNIKQILDLSVKQQLEDPEKFCKLGMPLTKGILLYGPPGCAKTILVKALAKECNTTFLATSAADLYSPYVGDAEKKIVHLFTQARLASPTILFIDEIDAVVGSKSGEREQGVQERLLSTLLIEMDGVGLHTATQRSDSLGILGKENCDDVKNVSSNKQLSERVIVMGATNKPQFIDDALKRPGRFDKLLYIPPPDESDRLEILKKLMKNTPIHKNVNLHYLAKSTDFYSGADLKSFFRECAIYALTETNMTANSIHPSHFEHVLKTFKPSLSEKVLRLYETFNK